MSYLALYRKYRSTNFDELVGQDAIKRTLLNSLKTQKVSHAYLFSGPRGTGKTSVARLFAKALNCEEGIGHICNECENCRETNEGSHPDVIEIDAASNSGVDEVRNLIEKVKYSPIKGRYKIYIIDEVHMMTNSAFNALLKTLEEPPSYVIFILCTTEPYKLLPTILSRCQRYDFKKISDNDLKTLLTRILVKEGVTASSKAIDLVVELANGGARDALSLLDQVISYSGNNIEEQDIIKMFGLTTNEEKIDLLKLIKETNTLKVLNTYEEYLKRNIDLSRYINELLNLLKDALVYEKTRNKELITSSSFEDAKTLELLFSEDELMHLIDAFMSCQNELKTTSNPYFLFEIYLLKLLKQNKEEPKVAPTYIEENREHYIPKKEIKPVENVVKVEQTVQKEQDPLKPSFMAPPKLEPSKVPLSPIKKEGESRYVPTDDLINLTVISNRAERHALTQRWNTLESLLTDPGDGPYAALLIDAKPIILTRSNLVILFDLNSPAEKANIIENQIGLTRILKRLIGRDVCLYALNRSEYTDLLKKYRNLQEINSLPRADDIEDKKLF